jgi:hypothetical protein
MHLSPLTHLAALLQSLCQTLGYRPFLDPIAIDDYWLVLLVPLVFTIALVYKTIKLDDLSHLPRQALHLAGQIVIFMVLAAAALWLLGALV